MKINFVDIFSKVLVINFSLLLVSAYIYYDNITAGGTPHIVLLLSSINGIGAFLYPAAILFRRTREKSYYYIKSWLHYIALTITALYWISVFGQAL